MDRLLREDFKGLGAAVGFHRVEARRDPGAAEVALERPEVAGRHRLNKRIQHGGGGPLIFAPFAGEIAGGGDGDTREALPEDVGDLPLVRGVGVAVEEADGDRTDLRRSELIGNRVDGGEVERGDDLALVVAALAHLEAQMPRHEWLLLAEPQVVDVGAIGAADGENVAAPLGGDECGLRAVALGEGIDHHRGAVHEVVDRLGRDAGFAQGVHDAVGEGRRRRGGFGETDLSGGVVEVDQIGECSADVGGESHWIPPGDANVVAV